MHKQGTGFIPALAGGYGYLALRPSNSLSLRQPHPRRPRCRTARPLTMTNKPEQQRILVLGGTGRVGTETVKALSAIAPAPLAITVAGRNASRGARVCQKLTEAFRERAGSPWPVVYAFAKVDINDEAALRALLASHDMVIHTAGPFQRKEVPTRVLKLAMAGNVPYMDVCDDLTHSMECKKLHEEAKARGYTSFISTGIYPGLSNLMAAEAAERLGAENVESLKLYYHTAGTGGIGATVLASTFLILSEDAICFDSSGLRTSRPAAGAPERIDFGGSIGKRTTYLLNLPEVTSLREGLFSVDACTEVFAKFSTGPPIWNWLLQAMAKWTPRQWLANRSAMLAFSQFSLPVVKAVDLISGARTGIFVVAAGSESSVSFTYEHESLARCVGEATAAFAYEMITNALIKSEPGGVTSGVLYPEELDARLRRELFENATLSANRFTRSQIER